MNENSGMHQVSALEKYLEVDTPGHFYHLSPVGLLPEYIASHPGTGINKNLVNNKLKYTIF